MRALVETVLVDGLEIRLRTLAPAGEVRDVRRTVLVLVHGIGMSHRTFTRVQAVLSRRHRTIAVDLPGFGGTRDPGRALQLADYARLILRVLRDRGVRDCVVLGQSMGAQVAVESAHHGSDIVRSVVLVGPVVDDARRTIAHLGAELLADNVVESPRMNGVVLTDYARSLRHYFRQLAPMLRYPIRDRVAALDVPVLVVRGSRDPIARRDWVERLVGDARRGTLVELPGAHHVQEHQPAAVARVVEEFLRSSARDGSR
jgi:pimeloyl-ACP methyl ester carboxylesterase